MSRIGCKIIRIPEKTTVSVSATSVTVTGPKGELVLALPSTIAVAVEQGNVVVRRAGDDKQTREHHGTVRSRLANMVAGVTTGYQQVLELRGVGYRAALQGAELSLSLGGIRPFVFPIPAGIQLTVESNTKLTVRGFDKELVGSVAANIRSYYPPEPYKGKGIRYEHEHVRIKAGKTAAAA